MPMVQDILLQKGTQVQTITANASVMDAIKFMNQHKIGALVVMDGQRVAGIFTERDVLRRVVAEELPVRRTPIAHVMTVNVICVTPDTDLDQVSTIMKNHRIRHLPVCDGRDHLVGMVSIGDVNAYHASHQEATIHFLNEYIYGRA